MLRSGKRSRYYLDKYRFETRPELLGRSGSGSRRVAADAEPDAVRLAAPALGAVALAASASLASGLPFIIVRDAAKSYGTGNRIEGAYETGSASVWSRTWSPRAVRLRKRSPRFARRGLVVRNAVCVVDREEGGADALARIGVRLRPLFRASELLGGRKKCRKTAWLSQTRRVGRVFAALKANDRRRGT